MSAARGREGTGPRMLPVVGTHRAFAARGYRDAEGRLIRHAWGNVYELFALQGEVDPPRLRWATSRAIAAQAAFGGRLVVQDGEDWFAMTNEALVEFDVERLSDGPPGQHAWHSERFVQGLARRFDLQSGSLTRVCLAEESSGRWLMLVVQDHSISDGWSLKLLSQEIASWYLRGKAERPADQPASPAVSETYFDWYAAEARTSAAEVQAAQLLWGRVIEQAADRGGRVKIPGGQWVPKGERIQDRRFQYQFTGEEEDRLKGRARHLGGGLGDLLLAGAQFSMMALAPHVPPIAYYYGGRRTRSTLRVMGLCAEELLTLPVEPAEGERLDDWVRHFMEVNGSHPSMGGLNLLDFETALSEENHVMCFNYIPISRHLHIEDDLVLGVGSWGEYEAIREDPSGFTRYGIYAEVWNYPGRRIVLAIDYDHRMCPWPARAARAMLYASLAPEGGDLLVSDALALVRSTWAGARSLVDASGLADVRGAAVELSEPHPGVALVEMCAVAEKNRLSQELVEGLVRAFGDIASRDSLRVVVLTGRGGYFSAGATKEALLAIQEGHISFTDGEFYNLCLACDLPVISAMQGHGIGGGFVLGLYADYIVLSRSGMYATNFIKYGFTPGFGSTLIVPKKLGWVLGQEMLTTGRYFSGAELAERGVQLPVVPRADVLRTAMELACELAEKPSMSLRMLKAHLVRELREQLPAVIERELAMQEVTLRTEEVRLRIIENYK
jgi:polyketide biosynthesis enoyl-CoA hydratase PksI